MKRSLLENVLVSPYESGAVINRSGFLSAIIAAAVTATGTLTFTVTHADAEDGEFEAVADTRLEANDGAATEDGVINVEVEEAGSVNVDLDLVGCKPFIKVTASGAAASGATFAYALGDSQYMPV